jgi:hypothetical protein
VPTPTRTIKPGAPGYRATLRINWQVGAVPAPFTTYTYYNSDKFYFYGEELMKRCMAYRSFIDAGIIAAAGSDFPPGPYAPLMGTLLCCRMTLMRCPWTRSRTSE